MPPDFKILSRDSQKPIPRRRSFPTRRKIWIVVCRRLLFYRRFSDAAYCIFSLRAYPDGHDRFAAIIEDGELDALTNALADSFVEDGSEI